MEETANWILRILAFIGIGIFLWSFAESFEKLAEAVLRIAKAMESGWGSPPPHGKFMPRRPPT